MENKLDFWSPKAIIRLCIFTLIGMLLMYISSIFFLPLAFALFGLALGFLIPTIAVICIKLDQKHEKEVKNDYSNTK